MGGLGGEAPQKKNSNPQIICYDPRLHDPTFEGGVSLKRVYKVYPLPQGPTQLKYQFFHA